MRASTIFSAFSALAAFSWPAPAAQATDWQAVARNGGERVDIDKARIMRTAPGQTVAWTRLVLGRELKDDGGSYTAVQAMNRYDCEAHTFATLRRVYLKGEMATREEKIASPKDVAAVAGSIDDRLLAEACKPRTAGEAQQVAQATVEATAQVQQAQAGKPGVMYADVRKADEAPVAHTIPVADAGKPEVKVEPKMEAKPEAKAEAAERPKSAAETKIEIRPAAERPRFIGLPKVDKAPSPPATAEKPADKAVAVTSTTTPDRRERERQYATTGPRRAPAVRTKPNDESTVRIVMQHREIDWGYEGEGTPANWGKLRADYGLCATGRRQSPIDIREGIRVDLEPIKFDYRPTQFRIVDNGHTVQVYVGEGSSISVMGRSYRLVEFHFHRPSEERINGKLFDMVIHFTHRDDDGKQATVAVLLEKGGEHPLIQTLWNNMPLEVSQDVMPAVAIDPNALLPESRGYYTYMGSETTPPCSEDVLWMVFKQPVQVSAEQIAIFSRLYRNNARPIQPSNNRLVKENR